MQVRRQQRNIFELLGGKKLSTKNSIYSVKLEFKNLGEKILFQTKKAENLPAVALHYKLC